MSTIGRKPRGFKKPPISLSDWHLAVLEKVQQDHHQVDRSAAVRWLIERYEAESSRSTQASAEGEWTEDQKRGKEEFERSQREFLDREDEDPHLGKKSA